MPAPLLSAEEVSRVYPKGGCAALDKVTLAVSSGDYVAVTGPSGSGKSTLLHLLCGLDRPTRGRVLFDGAAPANAPAWARLRARRIGFVFQSFNLLPTLTALQNVEVPMFGVTRSPKERRRRAESLLDCVGLAARLGHRPGELSGGEKQRLAIARSLANGPDVILADEPTGNLDSRTSGEILDLLEGIRNAGGTTLVLVTHDAAIARRAGRRIGLIDGRIVADESSAGRRA
jgi:ABC-type lipoprotein export system ATPase subunit